MKITGTEDEIRAFQFIAQRGLLDNLMDVELICLNNKFRKYIISFLGNEIEFESRND